MKLYKTLKDIILEVVAVNSVTDTIKKKQKIVVYYDGDEPGGKGLRLIEPVCFGYSKADNPVLRAWDLEGASHTAYKGEQPLPGWRLFRLDKILTYKPSGESFDSPRTGYNPRGDRSMNRVIINAVFDEGAEPTIESSINDIVATVVNSMINDIIQKEGEEYLVNVNLSKAAESYRQIYQELERRLNRKLTPEDKDNFRSQIQDLIRQSQDLVINNIK
jgi:predicted DNA-binding transcriptional regulator YafY